jgi:hypothetical protein
MIQKKEIAQLYALHKHQLQANCSEILALYLQDSLSQKQVSLLLNQSMPATRNQLAKALHELRKIANDPMFLKAKEILYNKKEEQL